MNSSAKEKHQFDSPNERSVSLNAFRFHGIDCGLFKSKSLELSVHHISGERFSFLQKKE